MFGRENRVEEIIWVQNTTKNQSPTYSTNHEYVEVYAKDLKVSSQDERMFREPKPGSAELLEVAEKINPDYPTACEIQQTIADLFEQHRSEFRAELEEQDIEYDKSLDLWKGLYNYSHADTATKTAKLVPESRARAKQAKIWIWREDNPSMPAGKQADSTKDPEDPNFRFYKPTHPNGKTSGHPKRGWCWPRNPHPLQPHRPSFSALDADNRIVWGDTQKKVPQLKKFLHEVDTQVAKSVVLDYTDGEKQLTNLFGATNTFPNPKPTTLISRFVLQTTDEREWVMDFFSGSGTAAHAVAEALHTDRVRRRFLLIESADYFDSVLLPRIKKVFAANNWKGGKAVGLDGPGVMCKVCSLEQYEDAVGRAAYSEEEELFRNTKTDPYSQYVFFRDLKMVRAIELDYKKDEVNIYLDRLYPDIDLAETLSCVTGQWIKRITEDEVEFADGSKQSLKKPDWRLIRPLIFWGPIV